jgi:hypothetical protein
MTTLIIAKKRDGRVVGRCDARCHTAKNPKCTCICGGLNHGVGTPQAIENTQGFALNAHYAESGTSISIRKPQLTLFEEEKR